MRAEAGRETVKLDSWLLTCRVVLIEVLLISNIAHHCVLSTTYLLTLAGAGQGLGAPPPPRHRHRHCLLALVHLRSAGCIT